MFSLRSSAIATDLSPQPTPTPSLSLTPYSLLKILSVTDSSPRNKGFHLHSWTYSAQLSEPTSFSAIHITQKLLEPSGTKNLNTSIEPQLPHSNHSPTINLATLPSSSTSSTWMIDATLLTASSSSNRGSYHNKMIELQRTNSSFKSSKRPQTSPKSLFANIPQNSQLLMILPHLLVCPHRPNGIIYVLVTRGSGIPSTSYKHGPMIYTNATSFLQSLRFCPSTSHINIYWWVHCRGRHHHPHSSNFSSGCNLLRSWLRLI